MADKKITTYNDATEQEANGAKLLGVVSGVTKLVKVGDVKPDMTDYVQKSNTSGLLKNDGTVDTNTYLTQHQDISGKQDKLISGTNIKTINNESLLGAGNITIKGSAVQSDWNQNDDTADDYIKNKPTIVSDPNYVHTDNNFTTTLKNQIDTNALNIANLQESIPAVVDATLEYDLISVYNTNIYRAEIVDFDYDSGQAPTTACDIQANVIINLYNESGGQSTKVGEFTMTSRGKFVIASISMGQGQSIQAEHITLPLMFGQNYIVDCDILGMGGQYSLITPTTLVEDAIQQKVDYSDVQLTEATFNGAMYSGEYYVLDEPISSLTVTGVNYNTIQESTITFTVSGSSFDVTLPAGTKIIGDKPLFANGSTYIMSFFNGTVVFGEVNTYVNPA